MVDVIPVSDPNSSTMAQRVVQYQAALQMAQTAPQIYDLPQLHRQMLDVLGIKNAEKLIPLEADMEPKDPVSENMAALVGKPMKAFIYQDHQAHIASHMAFMQDPQVAQMIGQNPQAQQIMMSLQAHIAEHLGFQYRQQIEEKLGVTLPAPNQEMPEEVEVQLSRLVADAGQQLTQAKQQQAAQAAAQQQAQDPMFQLKQQELALKQAEVQRKAQKDAADAQAKETEAQRKAKKDLLDAMIEAERLKIDQAEVAIQAKTEGVKIRVQQEQAQSQRNMDLMKTIAASQKQQSNQKQPKE
jgi:hypothetical protein